MQFIQRIFSAKEIQEVLALYGYSFSQIQTIKKQGNNKDTFRITIAGQDQLGQPFVIEFPLFTFQHLLGLPSGFFRIYRISDINLAEKSYQFIGNFLDFKDFKVKASLSENSNLVSYFSHLFSRESDYRLILESLYPFSYLARLN